MNKAFCFIFWSFIFVFVCTFVKPAGANPEFFDLLGGEEEKTSGESGSMHDRGPVSGSRAIGCLVKTESWIAQSEEAALRAMQATLREEVVPCEMSATLSEQIGVLVPHSPIKGRRFSEGDPRVYGDRRVTSFVPARGVAVDEASETGSMDPQFDPSEDREEQDRLADEAVQLFREVCAEGKDGAEPEDGQ